MPESDEWESDVKSRVGSMVDRAVLRERHDIERMIESAIQRTNRDNGPLIELLSSVSARPLPSGVGAKITFTGVKASQPAKITFIQEPSKKPKDLSQLGDACVAAYEVVDDMLSDRFGITAILYDKEKGQSTAVSGLMTPESLSRYLREVAGSIDAAAGKATSIRGGAGLQ